MSKVFSFTLPEHQNPKTGEMCADTEVELDAYYEPADREVGIMCGGYCLDSEVPDTCPECGYEFSQFEQEQNTKAAQRRLDRLEEDEADSRAEAEAERYWEDRAEGNYRLEEGYDGPG